MSSIPGIRFDITGASGSQGLLSPKSSWRAYILPRGGAASQDSAGTLITFDSAAVASRFAVNNWIQAGLGVDNVRQVSAVGGNSISVSGGNLTVSENDRIFIIGNTEPTVVGGSATYTTPDTLIRQRDDDGADLYANSMVTTDSNGLVQFFSDPLLHDCIIQDGNQSNQAQIVDLQVGALTTATRYASDFARGSSTGGVLEAIDDLPSAGGKVYVSDSFSISAIIDIAVSNVWLCGAGMDATTITLANSSDIAMIRVGTVAVNNIHISDLKLDGNKANQSTPAACIQFSHSNGSLDNFEVNNVHIVDSKGNGIAAGTANSGNAITGLNIHDCLIDSTDAHAITCTWDAPGARIHNNYIKDTGANANGIWLGQRSNNAVISDNYILNAGDMGIEVWGGAVGNEWVAITGNVIRDPATMGISVASNSDKCAVVANTIATSAGSRGIEIANADYVSVAANTIEGAGQFGVELNKSSFCAVTGNVIKDIGTASPHTGIRIFADGTSSSDFNVVNGNVIHLPSSGDVSGVDVFCNAAAASASNNMISGNMIRGQNVASSAGIILHNPIGGGTADGNKVSGNYVTNVPSGRDLTHASQTGLIVDSTNSFAQETATGTYTFYEWQGQAIIDSNGGAVTATQGSGLGIGDIRTIVMTDASNSSTVSVTNHETSDPEVITFAAVDDTAVLMWTGTEWITLKLSGATV